MGEVASWVLGGRCARTLEVGYGLQSPTSFFRIEIRTT